MVATRIEARGITDPLVLDAMRTEDLVPFVPLIRAQGWPDD